MERLATETDRLRRQLDALNTIIDAAPHRAYIPAGELRAARDKETT